MNLASGSIFTLVGFLCRFIFQIGRGILMARFLGPAGRGILGLLTTHCTTSSALGSLGLGNSFIYFIGKKKIHEDEISNYALVIGLFMGTLVALISWLVYLVFENSIFTDVPIIFSVAAIPAMILFNFSVNIIRGQDRVPVFNAALILHMGIGFVIAAAVLIPLYFSQQSALKGLEGENLEMMTEIWRIRLIKGAAISWFSGIIITSIITQLFARKGLNFTRTRVNLSRVRDMYAYSVRGYMQLVAENLNPVIGIFIIRYMLTTTDVGLFIVANSLLTIMGTPVLSISFVLFPKLSRADESSTLETALKVMKLVFLMLVTCSVILLLIGKPVIILLFGQEFEGSVIPLFYLLPGLISMGVFRILTDHLKSINRPEIGSYASSIGFVINIFLTIILLAPGRLYGASIGYSSSFLAAALLLLLYYRYKLDVPYIDLFLISRKDLRSYRKLAVNMVNFARNRMGR